MDVEDGRQPMRFFEKLNFASSNEDGQSEGTALASAQRILCLTGSGTRPLDLLLLGAEEIIAFDMNPMQNAALALKMAAIAALDQPAYLAFVGILSARNRLETYNMLRPALSPKARMLWDQRPGIIRAGLWYQGLWEKVLRFGAGATRLWRGKAIDALFAAKSITEQADIWQNRFDDRLWRSAIRMLGRRFVWSTLIGEPGGEFLPSPEAVEARLAGAFIRASKTFLFRDSDFASLILRGRHAPDEALPLHMMPASYPIIKARLSRIRIAEGSLPDLGTMGFSGIDGFSLSDFGSYCDLVAYAACWQGVIAAAERGARFCERTFMNPMPLPFDEIRLDTALSERLTQADRAIIYEIRAGTIGDAL